MAEGANASMWRAVSGCGCECVSATTTRRVVPSFSSAIEAAPATSRELDVVERAAEEERRAIEHHVEHDVTEKTNFASRPPPGAHPKGDTTKGSYCLIFHNRMANHWPNHESNIKYPFNTSTRSRIANMATKRGSKVDEVDESDVREKIVAAGRSEFALRGLAAASVHTIAQRAGVTAAMINYYYGGKQGLHDVVVAQAQEKLLSRLSTALGEGGKTGLAPRLAAAYFDFLAEDTELQRLLLREVLDNGANVRDLALQYLRPLRALLEPHVADSPAATQLAISLFGAVAGYFIYEPLLEELIGTSPLSAKNLAARRRHVIELASLLESTLPQ